MLSNALFGQPNLYIVTLSQCDSAYDLRAGEPAKHAECMKFVLVL